MSEPRLEDFTDNYLMTLFYAGTADDLGAVSTRYNPWLRYFFTAAFGDETRAEKLAQEVWTVVHAGRGPGLPTSTKAGAAVGNGPTPSTRRLLGLAIRNLGPAGGPIFPTEIFVAA